MNINYHSTVIICRNLEIMKLFYVDVLGQEIELDLGNCVSLKKAISLWQLEELYPIAQKRGKTYDKAGNNNIELCFETEKFDSIVSNLEKEDIRYLHKTEEERWGQKTIRFYDPENNLIEIGETIPCFVRRFANKGMSAEEVSKKTSVPLEYVKNILNTK